MFRYESVYSYFKLYVCLCDIHEFFFHVKKIVHLNLFLLNYLLYLLKMSLPLINLIFIYTRKECFTYGQLYVGLSRIRNTDNQFILLPQNKTTSNIVGKRF